VDTSNVPHRHDRSLGPLDLLRREDLDYCTGESDGGSSAESSSSTLETPATFFSEDNFWEGAEPEMTPDIGSTRSTFMPLAAN